MAQVEKAAQIKTARIERINELSQLVRTAWFSLLGYLVFVGITLLGVRDADFFVPSRQTDLPLVNVAIPTASFFWTAPVLGAALYTYLHLFLIKLWDAHGDARTVDADPTHHWLVNDFVLIRQRDPVARARPLWWLTDWITRLLIWGAGPIVLAYAWWRSMPAHNEWLTLLIAACFWLTLVVGFTSWWRAEERLGRARPGPWAAWRRRSAAILVALLLVATSWLRTEGGLDDYIDGAPTLDDLTFIVPRDTPVFRRWLNDDLILPLARTDFAGVELVAQPDTWRSPEAARSAFRETWCKREGLTMEACDQPTGPDHGASASVTADRQAWCDAHGRLGPDACAARFADLDRRFRSDWKEERESTIRELPKPPLWYRDLRGARAPNVTLVGAYLDNARLEGADLRWARLEGAALWQGRLVGADLNRARLEGANLSSARLKGTNLGMARLEGAALSQARLEGIAHLKPEWESLDIDAQVEIRCRTGRPVRNLELRIVDDEMREVAHDGVSQGEIVVRAPWLTQGYLNDPEGSERLWAGGWLHTGDIAVIDADGYVRITDRLKDVIKTGGEWVSSIELEDLILKVPGVSAAVIGVPDPKWTERPLAIVAVRDGAEVTEGSVRETLQDFAGRGFISRFAVPARVVFVEELPKTSVGKLDKKRLRQMFV